MESGQAGPGFSGNPQLIGWLEIGLGPHQQGVLSLRERPLVVVQSDARLHAEQHHIGGGEVPAADLDAQPLDSIVGGT